MRDFRLGDALRSLILAVFLVGSMVLSVSSAAFAHAGLMSAEPEDGALLQSAPSELSLSFSEPVAALRLTLVRPDGTSVDLPSSMKTGSHIRAPLDERLGRGTHALVWRVVSADGHPVTGSLSFSVEAASPTPDLPPARDLLVLVLVWGARVLVYIALIFGVGGAAGAYLVGAARPDGRRFLHLILLAGLLALPLAVLAQGLDALGSTLSAALNLAVWQAGLGTGFGVAALALALSFALALASTLRLPHRVSTVLSGLALMAGGVALASTGHAAAAAPQVLTRPAVALHALSAALWLGALFPLALALRQPEAARRIALSRFSRRIAPLLAVLLTSGVFLAAVQVGTLSALWQTDYGRVLLIKLALVLILFLIAADNRWRLTQPALKGDAPALRTLSRRLGFEIALGILVLCTVAVWRFTPPPRVEQAMAAEPIALHATGGMIMADIAVAPGRQGPVRVSALLMTIDYGPVDPQGVTFRFSRAQGDAEPIEAEAMPPGDGSWSASVALPASGLWHLQIIVHSRDGTRDRIDTEFRLKP
ncbi:copper resistance CopC/CopD family protein [Aureimonas sp. N4]|uniref:copper resistance CopC/CopD family protein n=1 Tax=Aureimonas sp. N4 TaxID=1638165 RepID=UPI000785CEFC|nr:copper resistance protein CopC [Aureimonas sp. N4]